uniref:Uncharacterized protein n=1 Tax=Caenorhabditis japonica TaxID=281687 RepID=A0A8R1IKA8_CAEJA
MTDAPEKKRRKLTSALREAIGAHTQKTEENIEKPISLALISDNKSAQDLLNKIQASRRPQAVLEATLKICEEKKCEAHVEEAFLSIFRKHFSVLGIDSAVACWKLLEEHLNKSESSNEIAIACEFIGTANLLGHGFGKLFQNIKSGLPIVIRNSWNRGRKIDALTLSYSFAMLLVAENMYGDSSSSQSQSPSEFWKNEILTEKSIKKILGMRMISALTGNNESIAEADISDDQIDFLAKVFLNHIEFFFGTLSESNFSQLLVKVIETHLEKNQLKSLASRIRSAEISITPNLYYALISVTRSSLELSDSEIVSIESLETLKLKEVAKLLPSVCEVQAKTNSTWKLAKKLENLLEFIEILIAGNGSGSVGEDNRDLAAFSVSILFYG